MSPKTRRKRTQDTSPASGDRLVALTDVGRQRLREEREQKGWSQAKLAGRVGVSGVFVCQLETGSRPRCGVKILTRMARALAVPPDYLAGLSDNVRIPVELPGGKWEARLQGDQDGQVWIVNIDSQAQPPKRGAKPQAERTLGPYGFSITTLLGVWLHLGAWRSLLLGPAPAANPPFTGTEQERFMRAMAEALGIILAPITTAKLGPDGVHLSGMTQAIQAIGALQATALKAAYPPETEVGS